MTTYATRDDALNDIANRSFYESARMYKNDDFTYTVEDWHTGVEESQEWTYENGLINRAEWLDYSRVHDPAEFYDEARHIEYNLAGALADIELGNAIGFTYVVAEETCNDEDQPDAHSNSECLNCDSGGTQAVGWALIATAESIL